MLFALLVSETWLAIFSGLVGASPTSFAPVDSNAVSECFSGVTDAGDKLTVFKFADGFVQVDAVRKFTDGVYFTTTGRVDAFRNEKWMNRNKFIFGITMGTGVKTERLFGFPHIEYESTKMEMMQFDGSRATMKSNENSNCSDLLGKARPTLAVTSDKVCLRKLSVDIDMSGHAKGRTPFTVLYRGKSQKSAEVPLWIHVEKSKVAVEGLRFEIKDGQLVGEEVEQNQCDSSVDDFSVSEFDKYTRVFPQTQTDLNTLAVNESQYYRKARGWFLDMISNSPYDMGSIYMLWPISQRYGPYLTYRPADQIWAFSYDKLPDGSPEWKKVETDTFAPVEIEQVVDARNVLTSNLCLHPDPAKSEFIHFDSKKNKIVLREKGSCFSGGPIKEEHAVTAKVDSGGVVMFTAGSYQISVLKNRIALVVSGSSEKALVCRKPFSLFL